MKNSPSALLDESETSEEEVLPTIITLIMFANTISALADILILSADSLIVFSNFLIVFFETIILICQQTGGIHLKSFWDKEFQNEEVRL